MLTVLMCISLSFSPSLPPPISYNLIFFLLTYLLPVSVMLFCYGRMGLHLWQGPMVGEETPALLRNYRNKKKVTEGKVRWTPNQYG